MKATLVAPADIRPGDETSLGVVTEARVSKSGKTITYTLRLNHSGELFTNRQSTHAPITVFNR